MTRPLESYQDEIYLTGLTGAVPDLPTDLGRLEEAARSVMTPRAFDYVAGAGRLWRHRQGEPGCVRAVAHRAADADRREYPVVQHDCARR